MAVQKVTIGAGDCVLSLAAAYGVPYKKIWEHPDNDALRELRKHPNVLLPGDVVAVPDPEIREEDCATEKRHRFRKLGAMVELRVRVHNLAGPYANEPFFVELDGKRLKGTSSNTDANGLAVCRVPANATRAILVVGKAQDEFELMIGFMDPADTASGAQGRLENLGYFTGGAHTAWDEQSAAAMRHFLQEEELEGGDVRKPEDEKNSQALTDTYSI